MTKTAIMSAASEITIYMLLTAINIPCLETVTPFQKVSSLYSDLFTITGIQTSNF